MNNEMELAAKGAEKNRVKLMIESRKRIKLKKGRSNWIDVKSRKILRSNLLVRGLDRFSLISKRGKFSWKN